MAAIVVILQWPMLKGVYYRTVETPAPSSAIAWRTDLDSALGEARRTQKRVLVDFSADWCPPCIVMKHDVWPDSAVEQAVEQSFVPVLIDVDKNGVVPERYGVEGIPAVLILDDDGQTLRRGSPLTAAAMVRFLKES